MNYELVRQNPPTTSSFYSSWSALVLRASRACRNGWERILAIFIRFVGASSNAIWRFVLDCRIAGESSPVGCSCSVARINHSGNQTLGGCQ